MIAEGASPRTGPSAIDAGAADCHCPDSASLGSYPRFAAAGTSAKYDYTAKRIPRRFAILPESSVNR
jgi:hypothetical protein